VNWRAGCNISGLVWATLTLGCFGSNLLAVGGMALVVGFLPLLDAKIPVIFGWGRVAMIAIFSGGVLLYAAWSAAKQGDQQLDSLKRKPKAIEGEIPDAEADYVVGDDGELVPIEDEKPKREQGR
jgi:hypothetical protein